MVVRVGKTLERGGRGWEGGVDRASFADLSSNYSVSLPKGHIYQASTGKPSSTILHGFND